MTFTTLISSAKALRACREFCREAEKKKDSEFVNALNDHAETNSSSDLAKRLNVSKGLVCDLRYGRRKVSDSLLEKLGRVS